MASPRKYTCPYCEKKRTRDQLPGHLERNHLDSLPEGFTPLRMTFHIVNHKPLDYTRPCRICGGPTQWDEHKGRYNFLCEKKSCHDAWVKKMKETMGDKMGSNRPTATKEGLAKMLAARKISGTYKFQDGGEHSYVGDYEKETLKFMDQVMYIKSEDITTPGPFLEYQYEGKTHYYIPDMYYIPYNLIIEVKDGGKNPNNNKAMAEVRRRSIAKEKFIIENTDYNYLKLTDKDFSQLLSVFADLKMHLIDNDSSRVIHVNENTDIINEKYTEADWRKNKNLSPVFIVNTFIGSGMGVLMRDFLNMTWSHALLSFEPSLNPMYSFDRIGLHIDNLNNYIDPKAGLVKEPEQSLMRVIAIFVPPTVKAQLVKSVDYYIKNQKKTKYGVLNLVAYLNGSNKINSYGDFYVFCSEFVDAILKNSKIDMSGHSSRNTSPDDFGGKDARAQFFKVYEGLACQYNPVKIKPTLEQLKHTIEYRKLTVNGGENHMQSKNDIHLGKKDSWPVVGQNTLNMLLHRNSVGEEMDLSSYLIPKQRYLSETDGGGIPANCGTMNGVIVVNYLQNNVFNPDGDIHDKLEYGIADNFRLDNIVTTAGDKVLHNETSKILWNSRYSVYFVPCNKNKVYDQLKEYINKPVPNQFIYETVFGHKAITNDQIEFEPGVIKMQDYYQQLNSLNEAIEDYIKYNIIPEEEEDKQILEKWFVKSTDGATNCCLFIRGYEKPCRGRSSMLILKKQLDGWYIYLAKEDRFSAPGGGWNENETPMEAAIREAKEEVRINVTDVQFSGTLIEYHEEVQDWVKQHVPDPTMWWYGYYSRIYVGMYQSQYTGKIDDIDKDNKINTSEWYKVSDIIGNPKMPREYSNAILWYIFKHEKNMNESSETKLNPPKDTSKTDDINAIIDSLSTEDKAKLDMPKKYQFDDSKTVKEIVKYKDNIPVAYFAIDYYSKDKSGNVSFAVNPNYRNQGFGSVVTKEGTAWIKSNLKYFTAVYWATKSKNVESQKLAEKNGWKVVRDDSEWKTYMIEGTRDHNNKYISESVDLKMTPEELSKWMKNNIKYANFTKLKSHDEVMKTKSGSCHDQVMFELEELKEYHPKAVFLIEANDSETANAVTHSFVYYQNNNRLYYFENAWGGHAGIKEFNDLNGIKEYFIEAHNKKEFGDPNRYPQMLFFNFGKHKPGETLNEFVTKATRTEI